MTTLSQGRHWNPSSSSFLTRTSSGSIARKLQIKGGRDDSLTGASLEPFYSKLSFKDVTATLLFEAFLQGPRAQLLES